MNLRQERHYANRGKLIHYELGAQHRQGAPFSYKAQKKTDCLIDQSGFLGSSEPTTDTPDAILLPVYSLVASMRSTGESLVQVIVVLEEVVLVQTVGLVHL